MELLQEELVRALSMMHTMPCTLMIMSFEGPVYKTSPTHCCQEKFDATQLDCTEPHFFMSLWNCGGAFISTIQAEKDSTDRTIFLTFFCHGRMRSDHNILQVCLGNLLGLSPPSIIHAPLYDVAHATATLGLRAERSPRLLSGIYTRQLERFTSQKIENSM